MAYIQGLMQATPLQQQAGIMDIRGVKRLLYGDVMNITLVLLTANILPVSKGGRQSDKRVRSPSGKEQCGETDGNLGNPNFGRFLVLITIGTK